MIFVIGEFHVNDRVRLCFGGRVVLLNEVHDLDSMSMDAMRAFIFDFTYCSYPDCEWNKYRCPGRSHGR